MTSSEKLSAADLGKYLGDVITPMQLAMLLGVSRRMIDRWLGAGQLEGCCRKRGRHTLILRRRALERIFNGDDWSRGQVVERTRVGERVVVYARGKRSLIQADFHYDGQHQRRSLKTADRSVAVERALELEAQIQAGTFEQGRQVRRTRSPRHTTLAYAREAFIDAKKTNGVRPKTISKYTGTLRGFAVFAARSGVIRVGHVTLPLVDAYRTWRRTVVVRGRLVGPARMYHDAALLKQFFKWYADRGMTASNPLANHRFHKPTPRRCQRVLTLDQINAVLATLPESSRGPVAMLAFAGMRSSDCRNLMVDDVDLDAGWVYVRSRDGAPTKCGNEWKTPIHPRLEAVLRTLSLPAEGYLFNAPPSPRHPLADRPINTKLLNDLFIKALKQLGIPAGRNAGFTIHSLRHFFKSFCICHGALREYVNAWQGHAGVSRASDLYVHTFDAESLRLMNQVPFGPTLAVNGVHATLTSEWVKSAEFGKVRIVREIVAAPRIRHWDLPPLTA